MVTSSQHLSHFLRHVNGLSRTTHTFVGKFSFSTPRGMAGISLMFVSGDDDALCAKGGVVKYDDEDIEI